MSGRLQRGIGLALLLGVVLVVAGVQLLGGGSGGSGDDAGDDAGPGDAVVVRGLIGGEKAGFLESPDVQRILAERHGLRVDWARAGSIEMVRGETTGQDFLWPSSQVALELYQEQRGTADRSEIIFNSPMVLYAWGDITRALVEAGLVEEVDGVYVLPQLGELVGMVEESSPWSDLGLNLYGAMTIQTTDPTKSNSGNMFAGLLANTLNGGQVVDEVTIEAVLPTIEEFYRRLGLLQDSSGDLFRLFLTNGQGAYPIIVGYESQLIEFSLANPDSRDLLRERINVIYPAPTVWSAHPIIALSANGNRLLDALKDPELQRLAWERHGFRSGLIGVQNDPAVLDVGGVPATIDSVIPMPKPAVMDRLIQALAAPAAPPAAEPATPPADSLSTDPTEASNPTAARTRAAAAAGAVDRARSTHRPVRSSPRLRPPHRRRRRVRGAATMDSPYPR